MILHRVAKTSVLLLPARTTLQAVHVWTSLRTFTFVNHEIAARRHGGHGRHVRNRAAALMGRHVN
jgi:hypothetical protein